MFSGDLYDIRSLSFDLLLACVSMLFKLAFLWFVLVFFLTGFFSYLLLFRVVSYIWLVFFSFGCSMVFLGWLPCRLFGIC